MSINFRPNNTGEREGVESETLRWWLFGSVSRRRYLQDVFALDQELRDLPIAHNLRQLVRGPRTGRPTDEFALVKLLSRMLCAGGQAKGPVGARTVSKRDRCLPEAVGIVAQTLKLDPASDAARLSQAWDRDPVFAEHCQRGYLYLALDRVRSDNSMTQANERNALKLIADMLLYHCALQVQLIAARGWQIDHLVRTIGRRRLVGAPCRFYEDAPQQKYSGVIASLIANVTDPIAAIDRYHAGQMEREPSQNAVRKQKPLARWVRANIDFSDVELLEQLSADWPPMAAYSAEIGAALAKLRVALKSGKADASPHEIFFGISSLHAVCFATTRLVQLRQEVGSLVDRAYQGEAEMMSPPVRKTNPENLARIDEISFVYRYCLLRDVTLRKRIPASAESTPLRTIISDLKAGGNSSSSSIIHELFDRKGSRARLTRAAWPGHGKLTQTQRFDIIPEYFLGWDRVRLQQKDPVALRKKKHEQDQKHRPAGTWRASGKGHRKPKR